MMQWPLRFRSALDGDIDAIMALEQAGFAEGTRESARVFRERIRVYGDGFLVAENPDGELKAYLCSELWAWPPRLDAGAFRLGHSIRDRHDDAGQTLYLSSLTVAPDLRGRGVARQLLDECLRQATNRRPDLRSAVLLVNAQWAGAINLYRQAGFRVAASLARFFSAPDGTGGDGLVMTRAFGIGDRDR